MAFHRAIRILLAGAAALVLASCGGGSTVVSDFHPARFVVFGDAMADLKLGASGAGRYTVNGDGTVNNWVLQLASYYGVTISSSTAKATAHARSAGTTDATGTTVASGGAASVSSQVTAWTSGFNATDLVVVSAGTSDLIAEGYKVAQSTQTAAAASANVKQSARDLAAEIRNLVNKGATHVLVFTPYNMGRTPWATAVSQASVFESLSDDFYVELVYTVRDLNENVLVVDGRFEMNTLVNSSSYSAATPACDPAATPTNLSSGLGIGASELDSSLCTSSKVVSGYNASTYLFADRVYPTPLAHRLLGDYAYNKLRNRW